MAETVGALILAAAAEAGATGVAGFSLASTTITILGTSVSLATVVGTAAIIGVSIGLSYALNNPNVPKAEDGAQALKQAVPPRLRGYGFCRIAGYYMLYEAAGAPPATSYDVIAFNSGQINAISHVYLSDDEVGWTGNLNGGGVCTVTEMSDGRYSFLVELQARLGQPGQTALNMMTSDALINPLWTPQHVGNGIAYLGMECAASRDPEGYTRSFPRGRPEPSVSCSASLVFDPRNGVRAWSSNPVLHLIDYLTQTDGGMGLDYNTAIVPNLGAWITAANQCDELVALADGSTEPRYACGGFYTFDNSPDAVIGSILATCDGWLAETGDGALTLTVGVYQAPTDPPLTDKHIFGFGLNYGTADEQLINQLDITYTDPTQKFVSTQADPWRDEASISLTGIVRSKPLDLTWVQSIGQARRLATRAMQRVNPLMTGNFVTSLYGLRYLGKRWVALQYPFVSGLQDCVVEIQNAQVDLGKGRINWSFIRILPDFIEAYDPNADQGETPPVPPSTITPPYQREDASALIRENGGTYFREHA